MRIERTIPHDDVVRLVRRHQDEVWRYLRYLGASSELADDLTQDAFVQLLRAPFEERSVEATGSWLRTVARHLFLRAFRRPQFEPIEVDALEATWLQFARDDGGDESLASLRDCLHGLEGRAREAVRLHYEERRSRGDIGERLGIGPDGVKSLLRRTRALLRDCIERRREHVLRDVVGEVGTPHERSRESLHEPGFVEQVLGVESGEGVHEAEVHRGAQS